MKNTRIAIAGELLRIAGSLTADDRELPEGKTVRVDNGKELVLVPPFDSCESGGRVLESAESGVPDLNAIGGNKNDRGLDYEIWAIDLNGIDPGSSGFEKVRKLVDSIRRDPRKKWILWTHESNLRKLMEICRQEGFIPDAVNDNVKEVVNHYHGSNSRKVFVQHYLDRRNLRPGDISKAVGTRPDGKKTVYAIDFDGTIAQTDDTFPYVEYAYGNVVDFIKDVIQPDPNRSWILYTCRVGDAEQIAERWCRENGLFPDAVNRGVRDRGSRKPSADYYIDDRNMDFSELR